MAIGVTFLGDMTNCDFGPVQASFPIFTLDSSYPTGGYALTANQIKVQSPIASGSTAAGIAGIVPIAYNTAATGYIIYWNTQTGKLMVYLSAGFTPAGTSANPTISMAGGGGGGAVTVNPEANGGALVHNASGAITGVTGVIAGAFTGTAIAAAKLAQVANATNLSTLVITCIALGAR